MMNDPALMMGQKCLPTYLVIDVSGSMKPHESALNNTLRHLHSTLSFSPRVSEFAHISIVAFSSQPWVVLEMIDLEYVPGMPEVSCDGGTNYRDTFDLVRQRIDVDVPKLIAAGKVVLRPCVFFLTDGGPTDRGWEAAFARLVDKSWKRRPHVVTYGFGDASEQVLRQVATKAAFLAEGSGAAQDKALADAIDSMLNSLVSSASAGALQIPVTAAGYRTIELEIMD